MQLISNSAISFFLLLLFNSPIIVGAWEQDGNATVVKTVPVAIGTADVQSTTLAVELCERGAD